MVRVAADGTATGYRGSMDSDSPPYTTEVVMAHLDDVHASGVSED